MKRSVAKEMEQLKTKLSGYTSLFNYNLLNICIEAEPVALLSVKIVTEDGTKEIENVAQVAVDEKYHFIVSPIYDDELRAIAKGIFKAHPEFKQEIKTWDGYDESDPSGKYLYCTMPEVNKDRRDVMNTAVDALYNKCKSDMEVANAKCTSKVAMEMFDNSPEEIDKVKEYREQIVKQFEDIREKLRTDKLQEIENAYQDYLAKQVLQQSADIEREQAEGHPTSIKLDMIDS